MFNSYLHCLSCNAGPLLAFTFFLLLLTQIWDAPDTLPPTRLLDWPAKVDVPCTPIPGLENVLVVLKTGATESLDKLPIHFDTTLRCVPHFVVFSDYEEYISGHHVYDVLEDVDETIKRTNPDFELYNRLQHHGRAGFNDSEIAEWSSAANTVAGTMGNPAWRLDKWKFLPLIEKSFRYRPEAKWFVFMEADTYMVWPNLVEWLSQVDASKPYYFGSQAQIGDVVFGHGGSGFIVSNPAMQMVAEDRATHTEYYHEYTASQWAGDGILGKAMGNAGVSMTWSWPHLQGGQVSALDFGQVQYEKEMWCYEAVSYHHETPEEILAFWEFEQDWHRQNRSVLLHADVFEHFVVPKLAPERVSWNNLADTPISGVHSFEDCRKACEEREDCVQFSYSHRECQVSPTIRLGNEVTGTDNGMIRSGWIMDRVRTFVRDFEECEWEQWILD